MAAVDVLAYREGSRVTVEVSGIIDLMDRDAAAQSLHSHVETCETSELVVRLHNSIVTAMALRVLEEAHEAARARDVELRVVVPPVAVRIFSAAGMDFLLSPEAYRRQ